jgi:hypothetical protein
MSTEQPDPAKPPYEAFFPTPRGGPATHWTPPPAKSPLLAVVDEFRDRIAEREAPPADEYEQFFPTRTDSKDTQR